MGFRRQEVSTSSWVSCVSVGVAGWYSSKKPRRWASNAARSSEGRTAEAAVKPWRKAFWEERCLPESVRGPVECCELARLTAVRARRPAVGERLVDAIGAGKVMVIGDM